MKIVKFSSNREAFIDGAAKVLNFGGFDFDESDRISTNPEQEDKNAILSDWTEVGKDIWKAYGRFKKEVKEA